MRVVRTLCLVGVLLGMSGVGTAAQNVRATTLHPGSAASRVIAQPRAIALAQARLPSSNYAQIADAIRPKLTPAGTNWVARNSISFRNGSLNEDQIRVDAGQQSSSLIAGFANDNGGDIEALVFLVMTLVAKDPNDDLRSQMATTRGAVQNKNSALADLSAEQNLKLQMAMDRMSKMEAMLSNILKKNSDTQAAITNNIK
jgi:hypothetical protein